MFSCAGALRLALKAKALGALERHRGLFANSRSNFWELDAANVAFQALVAVSCGAGPSIPKYMPGAGARLVPSVVVPPPVPVRLAPVPRASVAPRPRQRRVLGGAQQRRPHAGDRRALVRFLP